MTAKSPTKIIAEPPEFDVWLDGVIQGATQCWDRLKERAPSLDKAYAEGYLAALRRVRQELES